MLDLDFRRLVGHKEALATLRKGGRREPFPSLVFGGPAHVGKRLSAIWYAAYLNCLQTDEAAPCGECTACRKFIAGGHPDIQFTRVPEKKTVVGVSDVRDAIHEINHAPFEGNFRVWVIEDGERLSDEAQNALLKNLEEPPQRAVILLVTSLVGTLLPTVSSRCRLVRFGSVAPNIVKKRLIEQGAEDGAAGNLAGLSGGSMGMALRLLSEPQLLQEQEQILKLFHELPGQDLYGAIETAKQLEKTKHTSNEAMLALGISLYRDLLMLSAGSPDLVVHKGCLPQLESLASRASVADIRQAIGEFQEADHHLHRNVSVRLLLQRLCVNLSKVILC